MFETPIKSGLVLKCGRCGKGALYRKYLKLDESCTECGLDYSVADTADGPAFFVGFLMMILFAPFYFILPVIKAPVLVLIVLWTTLIAAMGGFCYLLLPRFKGVLFNLQVRHKAEEAKFESTGKHGTPPKNWRG